MLIEKSGRDSTAFNINDFDFAGQSDVVKMIFDGDNFVKAKKNILFTQRVRCENIRVFNDFEHVLAFLSEIRKKENEEKPRKTVYPTPSSSLPFKLRQYRYTVETKVTELNDK